MHPHDDPFDDSFGSDPFDHEPFEHSRVHHDPFEEGWSSTGRHHGSRGPIGIAISVVVALIALGFIVSVASDMGGGPEAPGVGPAGGTYDDPCVVRRGEGDDAALDRCVDQFDRQFEEDGFGF